MRYLAFLLLSASLAPAATLYTDNFDASVIGLNTAPTGWSTSNGTVDVVSVPNIWGIICQGGLGACVDLDGSTGNAGVLTSNTTFNLTAGESYVLSFYLSGNQRNSGNDTVTVSFGGVTQNYTLAGSDPFTKYSLLVNPGSNLNNQAISFENAGGDNIGVILDSVSLDTQDVKGAVPEPSTMAFAGIALLSAGLLKFRKRSN